MNRKEVLRSMGCSIVALTFIGQSVFAQDLTEYDEPTKLSNQVNSDAEESMPLLTKDGKTMYFVRTLHEGNKGGTNDQDIWKSELKDGVWKKADNSISPLNNELSNGIVGISEDGNTVYLLSAYKLKSEEQKGISKSEKKGGKWSKPELLKIPNMHFEGDFYGFYVNRKEDVIIVSMKPVGGSAKEDLFVSRKDGSGNWSAPKNLGTTVNTGGFEFSPFLADDGKTLYFASSEHGASGKSDIFMTTRQDDSWTNWSAPTNLGAPINSDKFDAFFSVYPDSTIYFVSNREEGRLSDIYSSKITKPEEVVAEEVVEEVKEIVVVSDLQKFFGYNDKDIAKEDNQLVQFIAGIGKLIEANGAATIAIESSASKVPTTTFSSNQKLAQLRADNARKVLEEGLKKQNIDVSKVSFAKVDALVQGPAYGSDHTNKQKYASFQYVKASAK